MDDIAKAAGLRKASLYHHTPGGKEELFAEVVARNLGKHKEGVENAIHASALNLEAQLKAVARWLIAHAPMGLLAMLHNDLPALSTERAAQLEAKIMSHLWWPIRAVFIAAQERGEIRQVNPDMFTGAFLSLMDGVTYAGTSGRFPMPMEVAADELIRMMLYGLSEH